MRGTLPALVVPPLRVPSPTAPLQQPLPTNRAPIALRRHSFQPLHQAYGQLLERVDDLLGLCGVVALEGWVEGGEVEGASWSEVEGASWGEVGGEVGREGEVRCIAGECAEEGG